MIELAVNYSPEAAALVAAGAVTVDRFKCPPWPDLLTTAGALRPVYVHFDFQAGRGAPAPDAVERAAELATATKTPWVNTHLSPLVRDLTEVTDVERPRIAIDRATDDVGRLVERFGRGRVMVENVPWERRAEYEIDRVAADPEVVSRVVEATGAGLLLDLAHARFAALELGVPVREYVEALPVTHLRELHVTGLGFDAEGRRRDHLPLTADDLALLAWALDRVADGRWGRPWVVALEYGGIGPLFEWRSERGVLARELPRVAGLLAERGLGG